MLAFAFVNPGLLLALPLVAVPIVIHLLNRRRYRAVRWAAMEYLLAAMQRNRKRLVLEQWLVLLLRTLLVLLLVLVVCRPQLGSNLFGSRTHHVVVVDDSASMRQVVGTTTLFAHARERVRALAEQFAQQSSGDLLTLVRTSRAQADLAAARIGADLPVRVAEMIADWHCSDLPVDLGQAVQTALQRARSELAPRIRCLLLGDRRLRDYLRDEHANPSLLAALRAMDLQRESLTVEGCGVSGVNLAITEVQPLERKVVVGMPARYAVEVANEGLEPAPANTLAIELDAASRTTFAVPPLAPGERVAVPFTQQFAQPGPHHLDCSLLSGDAYNLDDRRTLAVDVASTSRVLLLGGEALFLQAALAPEGASSGIEVVVGDASSLELSGVDVVWLCNPESIDERLAQQLEPFVAAGGGLVFTCGAAVDVERGNRWLWKDGKGLLPLPLGQIDGDPDRPEHALLTLREHAICGPLADVLELLTAKVWLVRRWLTMTPQPAGDAAIVARIRDAQGPALLAARRFGDGECVAMAVGADDAWSNLPATHLFVVLAHQIHRAVVRASDSSARNLASDGVFRHALPLGTFTADATITALAGEREERTLTAQASQDGSVGDLRVLMAELRGTGAFDLTLRRHDGSAQVLRLARNAPASESDLAVLPTSELTRVLPPELQSALQFATHVSGEAGNASEVWWWCAAAMLVGMLLESLLAWRFGRH